MVHRFIILYFFLIKPYTQTIKNLHIAFNTLLLFFKKTYQYYQTQLFVLSNVQGLMRIKVILIKMKEMKMNFVKWYGKCVVDAGNISVKIVFTKCMGLWYIVK